MASFFYYLTLVAMAAVVFVLIRGLINMMRGGSGNLSNKLMQLRVLLQFIAVVLIVVVLWITGGGR
ncbi:twin transmembrane helix small protein [Hoeflea prorocentri]|uniref:Twin transmembrane helix small protein n=1 Tax=Hoeflea prorocentri TaxID=1922333 RepID=A0A9X3ZJ69_9HYPH|nr:twin transmembrane helix small protein [Hoeflea prorocentri]MCY6383652.1 twin transmembrane helix small protein [Hoeflea prorocentri]MDA5401452.1 twin transmembrane helix small protein [Hoeflea prorocentri]